MITKYQAKEGYVFDFAKPFYIGEDKRGNLIKKRLYVDTLYLDENDSIDNYTEVAIDCIDTEESKEIILSPDEANEADYKRALAELGVE